MARNTRWVRTGAASFEVRALTMVAAGALSLATLVACSSTSNTTTGGASSSTASTTTAGSTPGTTAGSATGTSAAPGTSTSTTAKPSPQAAAATLVVADLGGEWKTYPTEKGVVGEGKDDPCKAVGEPTPPLDPSMVTSGDILQRGDRNVFLQSTSWVFPDAASASAFVQKRLSKAFGDCRRAKLEADLADRQPKVTVEVSDVQPSDHTKPYQGLISFDFTTVVDGQKQINGTSRHLVFLKGSTVIDVFDQYGALPGDPPDLTQRANDELIAAMDKVAARIQA